MPREQVQNPTARGRAPFGGRNNERPVTDSDSSFRALLGLVPRSRIFAAAALGVLLAGANLVQPAAVGGVIQAITNNEPVAVWVVVLVIGIVGTACLGAVLAILLNTAGEAFVRRLRERLVHSVFYASVPSLAEVKPGDLISRVGNEAASTKIFITQGLAGYISGTIMLVGATICMAVINATLLASTAVVIFLSLAVITRLSSRVGDASRKMHDTNGAFSADLERAYGAVRLIRLTNTTATEEQRLVRRLADLQQRSNTVGRVMGVIAPISNTIFQVALVIVLALGGAFVAAGTLAVDGFVSFLLYLFMALTPLNQIFSAAASVSQVKGTMTRLSTTLHLPAEDDNARIYADSGRGTGVQTPEPSAVWGSEISFSHPKQGDSVSSTLNRVSFAVNTGEFVAIVGKSGAGKSTLLNVIYGFIRNFHGVLLINGRDIRALARDEITQSISVVEQGGALIDGTIYENVSLGNPGLTRERCVELLDMLGLSHVARTDAELDRPVGDRGVSVSGGERQRIAIARAIASDAPILVLDEATANLDTSSESAVLSSIVQIWHGRTVLFVTHHLQIAEQADRIIFLKDGSVASTGSHLGCLRSSAEYRDFVEWSDTTEKVAAE